MMFMSNIELLAPAGNMDSLIAAVENGADAVYIGGKNFSARQSAANFDRDEIVKAIEYCHLRGVKLYITINILLKDKEIPELPEYVTFLYNNGIDAVIVQDLGVGKLLKSILPDLEIHGSTQMTVHNLEGVNLLYSLGYKRVVLSRELSLNEIEYICKNTPAEIEIFAHGALCICYSGQCLMSSMIGGRSGNRGRCAQPCRQKYTLTSKGKGIFEGYVLSPKDLNTLEHLDKIINCGVKSLKIEGRMKRPEYVASVISTYKKVLENYYNTGSLNITDEDKKNLLKVFNRGGFTTAHLFKKSGSEMMSFEKPRNQGIYIGKIEEILKNNNKIRINLEEDLSKGDGIEIWQKKGENIGYTIESITIKGRQCDKGHKGDSVLVNYKGGSKGDKVYKTFDIELNKSLEKTYKSPDPLRKMPIDCNAVIQHNTPASIRLKGPRDIIVDVKGPVPETALKTPLTYGRIQEHLSKLGGTPYFIDKMDIVLDDGLSMPVSVINSMRRDAIEKLSNEIIKSHIPPFESYDEVKKRADDVLTFNKINKLKDVSISVSLKNYRLVESAIKGGADIIVLGGDMFWGYDYDIASAVEMCNERSIPVYIESPRIIRQEFPRVVEMLQEGIKRGAKGIYVENTGILKYVLDKGIPYAAGFSLNIFNTLTASMLSQLGSHIISLSPELSISEIKGITPYIENCEALCYGRIEMMITEYCVGGSDSCKACNDNKKSCISRDSFITDRTGMVFPVKTDIYCRSHIFNSKILSMLENLRDLIDNGVNVLRLNMIDEDQDSVYSIVKAFKDAANNIMYGIKADDHNINSVIENIKNAGFTKGHYYRGVE